MVEPTRQEAQDLVAAAERASGAIRAAGRWYVAFLAGLGLVSAGWFAALAWVGTSDERVAISAGVFAVLVAGLCLGLLPRARANRRGFNRRFVTAMVGWAAAFAVGLTWGLVAWRGTPGYWLAASVLVALPAGAGAYVERHGPDGAAG